MPKMNLIPNEYILRKHPDITWRNWIQMIWNDIEWPLVIFLGCASLILGVIGFSQYQSPNEHATLADLFYKSLQLFSLQASFDLGISIPFVLQIARFLSPALAAYTLVQAFMEVFKDQIELFKLVRVTDHFIVCGLGQKGLLLIKDLRRANHTVVVIERDGNNPYIEICRELGAITIIGDARDSMVLLKSGVRQAKHLIAVCGEDGTNVEVAEQVRKLIPDQRKNILTCTVHIRDTYLWTILREREFEKNQASPVRLEMFNVYDTGARILLRDTLPLNNSGQAPHILIIGVGDLANNLIVHVAQEWCLRHLDLNGQLLVSVVDPEAKRKVATLKILYPLLNTVCKFSLHEYQTAWPEFQSGGFIQTERPITHAYICFDDTSLGLLAGFTLIRLLPDKKVQIMVRMTEDEGLATFLKDVRSPELKELSAFGLLDRTCGIGLLDDGTHESLARVIHYDYVRREKEKGYTVETNKVLVEWEELPEEIRLSNSRQADHISVKLSEIGCRIAPWRDYGAEKFTFTPDELELLSRMEHKRYCEEKEREGWKWGEKRIDSQKIHPDLVMWEDPRLTEEAKDKDREAVKLIPELLARAGFQIDRVT